MVILIDVFEVKRGDSGLHEEAMLAALALTLLSFSALAQYPKQDQTSKDTTETGAQAKQARKLATQTKTITGRLHKGYEPDEFSITAEDGKVWGLQTSAVKLHGHLGHKATVSGLITQESRAGEPKKGTMEKVPGREEYGDLRVARLKMVSETCGK